MKRHNLKGKLDAVFGEYHHPKYLRYDPLEYVRRMRGKPNREAGGLLCSSLAYGRVEQIRASIENVLAITGDDIGRFCVAVPMAKKIKALSSIKHRFNTGRDIALLLECIGRAMERNGSLEAVFCEGLGAGDRTIRPALESFVISLKSGLTSTVITAPSSFHFLLPLPSLGSTCKRLNMFLRWMVRPEDGIDLGEWTRVPASTLVMPVDTHVAAVSRRLGITRRKTVDWAMAEEVTAVMRKLYPHDPVRCDFSLCRTGMIDFRTPAKAA